MRRHYIRLLHAMHRKWPGLTHLGLACVYPFLSARRALGLPLLPRRLRGLTQSGSEASPSHPCATKPRLCSRVGTAGAPLGILGHLLKGSRAEREHRAARWCRRQAADLSVQNCS